MRTVWQYEIQIEESFTIELPVGAVVVAAQMQQGNPCMWVDLNSTAPKKKRLFHVVGTGHGVPPGAKHVATVQAPPFVLHLYESA